MPRHPGDRRPRRIRFLLSSLALATTFALGAPMTATAAATGPDSPGESVELPTVPSITVTLLSPTSANIAVGPGSGGGPVETFQATVTPRAGGEPTVLQRGTPGDFPLEDLTPGLYAVDVAAINAAGSAGVSNVFFVAPDISSAPVVTATEASATDVRFSVHTVNDLLAEQTRPTSRASTVYTLVLDDGIDTIERADSAADGTIGIFNALRPATTYTATITARYFFEATGWFGPSLAATSTFTTLPAAGPGTPSVPPAPSSEVLTEEMRGTVIVPATGRAGETVAVSLAPGYAGQTVNGWLYSSPASLGQAVVDAAGLATFTLPADAAPGTHRIALTDSEGNLLGWGAIQVASADRSVVAAQARDELAATGTEAQTGGILIAVLTLLAGIALIAARRLSQR